jgi:hypothetical protein
MAVAGAVTLGEVLVALCGWLGPGLKSWVGGLWLGRVCFAAAAARLDLLGTLLRGLALGLLELPVLLLEILLLLDLELWLEEPLLSG